MLKSNILIAGAGPAGSTAALLLAREGFGVTIIERLPFPRVKACGDYLSARTVRALSELGLRPALEPHARRLDGVRIFTGSARAELPFASPGWSLPRSILDQTVLAAAQEAGARVVRGRAVSAVPYENRVTVRMRDEAGDLNELTGNALIAADGAHSLLAKQLGMHAANRSRARYALGGHYTGLDPLDTYVQMFVEHGAYLAVNPLGANRANIMSIVYESEMHAHREDVDAFISERASRLSRGAIDLSRAVLEGKRIAIGPLAYRARAFSRPGVLLAGDAAQFVDPFTGQGVYLALHAAGLACNALLAVRNGEAQAPAFSRYARLLKSELRRGGTAAALASYAVRMPVLAPHARLFAPLLRAVSA